VFFLVVPDLREDLRVVFVPNPPREARVDVILGDFVVLRLDKLGTGLRIELHSHGQHRRIGRVGSIKAEKVRTNCLHASVQAAEGTNCEIYVRLNGRIRAPKGLIPKKEAQRASHSPVFFA